MVGGALDHEAGPVDASAVAPARAGLVEERVGVFLPHGFALADAAALGFLVARQGGDGVVVGEAGGVGQEMSVFFSFSALENRAAWPPVPWIWGAGGGGGGGGS